MSATRDRLHGQMLRVYGPRPGRVCRDCVHLVDVAPKRPFAQDVIACELASKTIAWAGYLTACGKLEERTIEKRGISNA